MLEISSSIRYTLKRGRFPRWLHPKSLAHASRPNSTSLLSHCHTVTVHSNKEKHMARKRILFICTHNSARSQMAEGLLRHLGGDRFEAFSAGTEATHVRPLAIRAMAELGIDISAQQSKTLERYLHEPFDAVITV